MIKDVYLCRRFVNSENAFLRAWYRNFYDMKTLVLLGCELFRSFFTTQSNVKVLKIYGFEVGRDLVFFFRMQNISAFLSFSDFLKTVGKPNFSICQLFTVLYQSVKLSNIFPTLL